MKASAARSIRFCASTTSGTARSIIWPGSCAAPTRRVMISPRSAAACSRSPSACRPISPMTTGCSRTAWSSTTRSIPGVAACRTSGTIGRRRSRSRKRGNNPTIQPVFIASHRRIRRPQTHGGAHQQGREPDQGGETMRVVLALAICATVLAPGGIAGAQEIDWKGVDTAFGRSAVVAGDVHRYGFPRSDLQVTLDGVAIKPAFALGGWIAFKPAHDGVMVMGDLVLLDTEVNPVMAKLLSRGLDVTAV